MKWTRGIYDKLRASSTLVNLVGNRVYPIHAPLGTALPYITYEVTSQEVEHSKEKAEFRSADFEVILHTKKNQDAIENSRAVITALRRESWAYTGADQVQNVFFKDQVIEHYEDPERWAVVSEFTAFVVPK